MLLENLVISFFSIWSIMKVYFICCILAQISYLGENLVPERWVKMLEANQIAGSSNQLHL